MNVNIKHVLVMNRMCMCSVESIYFAAVSKLTCHLDLHKSPSPQPTIIPLYRIPSLYSTTLYTTLL